MTPRADDRVVFDLAGPLPTGRVVIEASAGTGKTYSLTNLIVRYVAEAGVPIDQFLVVTFTRAAAAELRDRTRAALRHGLEVVEAGVADADAPWTAALLASSPGERRLRRDRLRDAITRFDDASITTIHGFCQQAIGQLGVRSGADPDAVLVESINSVVAEVCRDLLIDRLADDPWTMSPINAKGVPTKQPAQVERALILTVRAMLSNPGARPVPPPDADTPEGRWADVVDRAVTEVRLRLRRRGQIGYDDLIRGLRDALDGGDAAVVARQLADRSSVVLVDEFQDTDVVQWEVFERAFSAGTLVTVGDPKQAIYRFRGADVHAYLDAVDGADTRDLLTNHRSDRRVLAGIATLFDGAELGDDRIRFRPVDAPANAVDAALTIVDDPHPGSTVNLWSVPDGPSVRGKRDKPAAPLVRQAVLAHLVTRIIDLLDNGWLNTNGLGGDRGEQVRPGDIAVLVPSHAEAANVAEALRRADIPAVRTRTGSVYQTTAVDQWRTLLAALARPHHAPTVRAAALGCFGGRTVDELGGDDADQVLAFEQARCASWADHLRRAGLAALYDDLRSTSGVLQRLLQVDDGERQLTDLDHIGELLTAAVHAGGMVVGGSEPAQLLDLLEDLATDDEEGTEATMRRIDSDALAVQITTIHASKGLEYPVVLLPFAFKARNDVTAPWMFRSESTGRALDAATLVEWKRPTGGEPPVDDVGLARVRKRLAGDEVDGDGLRLLYVACTRAKHRLEIWWAPAPRSMTSGLARLLLDREAAGPVLNRPAPPSTKSNPPKPPHQTMSPSAVDAQLEALAAGSGGAIALRPVPLDLPPVRWTHRPRSADQPLVVSDTGGRTSLAEPAWRNWSFTAISAEAEARRSGHGEPGQTDVRAESTPEAPAVGGADETTGVQPDGDLDDDAFEEAPEGDPDGDGLDDTAPSMPIEPRGALLDLVAGTTFGLFLHAVLEHTDFTAADLEAELTATIRSLEARSGVEVDPRLLAVGLADAVRTPLGPMLGGRSLAQIGPRDRLAELTFDLSIIQGIDASGHDRFATVDAGQIGAVLAETLPADDPLRPYAGHLAAELAAVELSGWLHGSIDAVLRFGEGAEQRFVVVDYKSNRLHVPGAVDPLEAYRGAGLVEAMVHHHYPLQALLYSVALHRYLRWRLAGRYRPETHLGGVAYLFVRGMVGPSSDETILSPGVFAWRPPTATITALDDLFAGRRG